MKQKVSIFFKCLTHFNFDLIFQIHGLEKNCLFESRKQDIERGEQPPLSPVSEVKECGLSEFAPEKKVRYNIKLINLI